jgi:uncharacterized protein (DUF924 family)
VALCRDGLERGFDRALTPLERLFFYMPLLHSERLRDQCLALACFQRLRAEAPAALVPLMHESVTTAQRYRAIIFCFGRFPHRNAVLGRRPRVAERLFLAAIAVRRRVAERSTRRTPRYGGRGSGVSPL